MEPRGRWIAASELGEYAFCPRAYALRRAGAPVGRAAREARAAGTARHAVFLSRELASRGDRRSRALIVAATVLAAAAALALLGV